VNLDLRILKGLAAQFLDLHIPKGLEFLGGTLIVCWSKQTRGKAAARPWRHFPAQNVLLIGYNYTTSGGS
jgi:hypothetical protein